MKPEFNIPPYPWQLREAQQLHINLVNLYPTVEAALLLAAKTGIPGFMLNSQKTVYFLWKDILDIAGTQSLVENLVKGVREVMNATHPYIPFFDGLLAGSALAEDSEPRSPIDGRPAFISGGDDVTQPEALLYYDDLTLQIGKIPGLIKTLDLLVKLAPSVCKLIIDISGTTQYGTAFRIGEKTLLTNWHVLHRKGDEKAATAVTAAFGYELNDAGKPRDITHISCDAASVTSDKKDDWAIITTTDVMKNEWTVIDLKKAADPVIDASAFIIQHPQGEPKRIGYVRNKVCHFDQQIVHYLTDTQEGSSGAPVFNDEGKLIALHHAGGRPQTIAGKAPMKKNEGIRISRILEGLKGKNINIQ